MIDKSNLTLLYIIYAFNKTKEIEDILIKSFVLFNKTPMITSLFQLYLTPLAAKLIY